MENLNKKIFECIDDIIFKGLYIDINNNLERYDIHEKLGFLFFNKINRKLKIQLGHSLNLLLEKKVIKHEEHNQ